MAPDFGPARLTISIEAVTVGVRRGLIVVLQEKYLSNPVVRQGAVLVDLQGLVKLSKCARHVALLHQRLSALDPSSQPYVAGVLEQMVVRINADPPRSSECVHTKGGIRSHDAAREAIEAGAHSVILGSALVRNNEPDVKFAEVLFSTLDAQHLVFAIDSRAGRVAVRGWQDRTEVTPLHMIQMLELWCGAFLYTHIDTEGMMQGIPLEIVRGLRSATRQRLFVAGGITSQSEIMELDRLNVDAVVGMAIYTSRLTV